MAPALALIGRFGLIRALTAGIIAQARRRARRRRAVIASGLAALGLGIAGHDLWAGAGLRSSAAYVAPDAVLARSPYMGVACPAPNSLACDRLGLAVWLRRPANSVDATVSGWPMKLNWWGDRPPGSRPAPSSPRTAFDGFLQPAGLVGHLGVRPDAGPADWLGSGALAAPVVVLRVAYADGTTALTRLAVPLATGWG
jgi:hypothetical protein